MNSRPEGVRRQDSRNLGTTLLASPVDELIRYGSPLGVDGVLDVDSGRGEDEPAPDEYRQTLAEADGGHA